MVKFAHTVIFVRNIERTKEFYSNVLQVKIIKDYGIFLHYEGDLAFHQSKELIQTIFKGTKNNRDEKCSADNVDIYFETDNLEVTLKKLKEQKVEFIHEIEKQTWGQKVFRIYDPDGYVVEIGEPSFVEF